MTTSFSMKYPARKYVFQEFRYFFSVSVLHSVIVPITTEVRKTFLKRLLIRKFNFCVKKYFFQNKRKNLSPFCTDFPISFLAFRTLGAGNATNKEIMKPVRTLVSNRLNVDLTIQSKQSIINCSHSIQTNFSFATYFDVSIVTLAHIHSTFPLFPSPFWRRSLK